MLVDSRDRALKFLMPLTKVVGKIHLPHACAVTHEDYLAAYKILTPGMIFLTRTEWQLTNLLIPSESGYKHGAIYVGSGVVVEAVGSGVKMTWLDQFMESKDRVRVMSPLFAGRAEMEEAARFAKTLVGRPYDYLFKSGMDALYCFEAIYASYREARIEMQKHALVMPNIDWELREFWGEETVVADDFVQAVKKWKTNAEYGRAA